MQKKSGRKQTDNSNDKIKSLGLFDHIRQIQYVRDPHYFENLSEEERKSFSVYLILRGLSMNPAFVEYAAYLYQFFDIIPPAQFYKILIELYPRPKYKEFHKWIKSSKDKDSVEVKKEAKLIDLVVQKYETSKKEAKDYIRVFRANKQGQQALFDVIRGFGLTEKEVEAII